VWIGDRVLLEVLNGAPDIFEQLRGHVAADTLTNHHAHHRGVLRLADQREGRNLPATIRRREEPGSKSVSVARYGAYEVRLLQVVQGSSADPFIFWIELFDHKRRISLDSGSAKNLEKALGVAEELISHAEQLSKA
jgi:hypothetical protein